MYTIFGVPVNFDPHELRAELPPEIAETLTPPKPAKVQARIDATATDWQARITLPTRVEEMNGSSDLKGKDRQAISALLNVLRSITQSGSQITIETGQVCLKELHNPRRSAQRDLWRRIDQVVHEKQLTIFVQISAQPKRPRPAGPANQVDRPALP